MTTTIPRVLHPTWGEVPEGDAASIADGSFVIGSGPAVYWIQGGHRRTIPDPPTLMALSPTGWAAVVHVPDATLATIPLGPDVPSREDGKVYRGANRPEVYVIEAGARHHIPDPETLAAEFGGWAAVVVIDEADCDAIPLGAEIPSVKGTPTTVDAYLRSLPDLVADPPVDQHQPIAGTTVDVGGITYDVAREHAALRTQQSQPWILSPDLDALYPGALLQGPSLATGRLAPVAGGLPRAGGTLTVSTDVNSSGPPRTASKTVAQATLPVVQDARHQLVYELNPEGGAAVVDFAQTQARSTEHGMVKLGVSVDKGSFSGNLKASLDTDLTMTTAMVMLRQVFYSVEFTPPDGPNSFFDPSVTLAQVQAVCTADNPPCYISQVDYGRTLVATITGTESSVKLAAALTAGLKSAAVNGTVDISAEDAKTLSESSVSVVARGGTDHLAIELLHDVVGQLPAYLDKGGSFTPDNPGVPLRYVARAAGSRHIVAIDLSTDYEEAVAVLGRNVDQTFQVWDGPGGGPFSTGIRVGNADHLSITASGQNWSGVIFTGTYGPDGWTTWAEPGGGGAGYPLPHNHPFALCAAWDSADVSPVKAPDGSTVHGTWFYVGSGVDMKVSHPDGVASRVLYLGTNDNNPLNGDAKYKFSVRTVVTRRTDGFPNVGRAG